MTQESLREIFLEEASELLAELESGVLRLESGAADSDTIHAIFRCAHSLKGSSAMVGLDQMAHFAHAVEELLNGLRSENVQSTPRVVELLLTSTDTLRRMLEESRRNESCSAEDEHVRESLQAALRDVAAGCDTEIEPPRTTTSLAPPSEPKTTYDIRFRPPRDLLRRGLDPIHLIMQLERIGTLVRVSPDMSDLPELEQMSPEECYLGWDIRLETNATVEAIAERFEFVGDPAAISIRAASDDGPETMDRETRARGSAPPSVEGSSLRVGTDKVDRLIDLVGELVITQSMIVRTVGHFAPEDLPSLEESVARMDRQARELHERMMAVRTVPLRSLLGRFPRLVRDVAAEQSKQIRLETDGEDTEIDKAVMDLLADPLNHLVRNAIDHGIEDPATRQAAGKNPAGVVRIAARQSAGQLLIEVSDDGRGLDLDAILAKAADLGVTAPGETPSDEEIRDLIFHPGLSTAEKVTQISGRGVGMDVVRKKLESAGGRIAVESQCGQGTRFLVSLPLTLAIIEGQCLKAAGRTYVLPLTAIAESVRPGAGSISQMPRGAEAILVRGKALPLVRLADLLGHDTDRADATEKIAVVVTQDGFSAAVLVDELSSQQQVVIKSLNTHFTRSDGISGATILGDGRVAMILDVAGLLALARRSRGDSGDRQLRGRARAAAIPAAAAAFSAESATGTEGRT
jgi:two-component system chemotaxis sensor kinase CheA